jgi:hypothetical protein
MRRRPDGDDRRVDESLPDDRAPARRQRRETMKALAYLLAVPFLDLAGDVGSRAGARQEAESPILASTPETAAAWRRWADAGRLPVAAESGRERTTAARRLGARLTRGAHI